MTTDEAITDQTRTVVGTSGRGLFWMLVPIGLLVVSGTGWLSMVSVAVRDPGFSVEQDYYKKASNYDREIEQRAQNTALGWRARVAGAQLSAERTGQLTVQMVDAQGKPLDRLNVAGEAFAVARGGDIRRASFSQLGDGLYRLNVERARPGLWEVRIQAKQGSSTFTEILRAEFAPREVPPS